MFILISPAKKQNFEQDVKTPTVSRVRFPQQTHQLIEILKKLEPAELSSLMRISDKLAQLNFDRYLEFNCNHPTEDTAKPALFAFQGDVYQGLEANTLTQDELQYAQEHLGILSGLYGLLRPLDAIQAHRLEMGTKLKNNAGKDLYAFWQTTLTETIQEILDQQTSPLLINLASNEYSQAVNFKALRANIIKVDFKELKQGKYKTIGIFAKRARGLMARFIIQNKIETVEQLKAFDVDGYGFHDALSDEKTLVFTRG